MNKFERNSKKIKSFYKWEKNNRIRGRKNMKDENKQPSRPTWMFKIDWESRWYIFMMDIYYLRAAVN